MTSGSTARPKPQPEVLRPTWAGQGQPVEAGFTTRRGGVSRGRFAELNFSRRWPEDTDAVETNLALLAERVGFDPERLVTALQVHGSQGLCCDDLPADEARRQKVDFLVTRTPGLVVGVITADCVPVLLWEPRAGCVAAVHAGWRGAVAGVVDAAVVELAERYGAWPERMHAAVGPGIEACCFEVGPEVADAFVAAFGHEEELVVRPDPGKPHVDLVRAVKLGLEGAGVRPERIERVGGCTCCAPERFFSYRRDGAHIGQHLSFVGIR